jgi:betaine-aldehyde dehydrogenase
VAPAQDSEIVQQEVFGPVVTVQRAADETQALAWANDTDYGLAASIWTRNTGSSLRAARDLNFCCVWINTHLPFVSEMPHGGFGQSGYGKDLSLYAMEEYPRVKHVMASLT